MTIRVPLTVSSLFIRKGQRPTMTSQIMTSIVQVEYSPSLLSTREEILQSLGHPVVSALGMRSAKDLTLSGRSVGVVVIGHGAPRQQRHELIIHFQHILPGVPIVALLRRSDSAFDEPILNCPADDPTQWIQIVQQALVGVQ